MYSIFTVNMSYIRIVALCAIFLATSTQVHAKKYYPQTGQKVNWVTAFQRCLAQNMQLATINSAEEQNDIEKAIVATGLAKEWMWISGTDLGRQGEWVWMSTGKPLTYNKWSQGQPDFAQENCMHLWENGKTWNNWLCNQLLYFICEDGKETCYDLNITDVHLVH